MLRRFRTLTALARLASLVAFAVVFCVFRAFAAGETDDAVARARTLIESKLEFSQAITLLESALERGELDGERRVEAYYWIAVAHVARNESDRAVAAFASLLALDPRFELDAMHSPKVREAFARAKQSRAAETAVTAAPEPAVKASPDVPRAPSIVPAPIEAQAESTPWYGHWWLWVGLAVAVAAAGTTAAVIMTRSDDGRTDPL